VPALTVRAARYVVNGTAATRPMDPMTVRTISTATISEFAARDRLKLDKVRSSNKGIAAPA
jgi:hypothetical protein